MSTPNINPANLPFFLQIIVISLKNFTGLLKAMFCASAAHVLECTLALRFSNITFFADCKILN
jgi:hypothetical protein